MKSEGVEKGGSDSPFLHTGFKNWKDATVAFYIWLLIYQLLMKVNATDNIIGHHIVVAIAAANVVAVQLLITLHPISQEPVSFNL